MMNRELVMDYLTRLMDRTSDLRKLLQERFPPDGADITDDLVNSIMGELADASQSIERIYLTAEGRCPGCGCPIDGDDE